MVFDSRVWQSVRFEWRWQRYVQLAVALLCVAGCSRHEATVQQGAKKEQHDNRPVARLASGGRALMPIVVVSNAAPEVTALAEELATQLQRIAGATFQVVQQGGEYTGGIQLAAPGDFARLPADFVFNPDDPLRRDEYRIRSHREGVWLAGATPQALSHAVWGLLDTLGYRLFFMTDRWEVVPELPELELLCDEHQLPDFVTRDAPRGAPWSDQKLWSRWLIRNRIPSAFKVSTGHAYDHIIRIMRQQFADHPEYFALVDGERRIGGKFCIGNPGLRQLVIDYAVQTIRDNPELESLSMDPSDGSGWCQCDECAAIGAPSDLALLLANEVAVAINQLGLGDKYVGIYAYNQHSPPPKISVHPMVVVSVATSFIRGGYTVNELVDGWRARGATLGIRDYHDVFTWSHDMPRRARGGDLTYLSRQIPYFHAQGARFMNSENGDSWGANGLGFWITPRLLWRVADAARIDELVDDFVTKAFGVAAPPMAEFYDLLNRDKSLQSDEQLVAAMYRHLARARELAAGVPAVMERLDDLLLYTRYCELYHSYRYSQDAERQAAFEALWRHTYRMRDRYLIFTVAICHREKYRDRAVTVPPEAEWRVPEAENPWKESTPFTATELEAMLAAGIAANQPLKLDFTPVTFSSRLVPAAALPLPESAPVGRVASHGRGTRKFHFWLDGPQKLQLSVKGGMIAAYRDRGNVKIRLFAEEEATLDAVASDDSVPPDGEEHVIELCTPYGGLHTLEISDGGDMTDTTFVGDLIPQPTFCSSRDERAQLAGRWTLYAYVPRNTRAIGGYATSTSGTLVDSRGEKRFDFATMKSPGYFSIPVPAGEDGTFWRFEGCSGERYLMTIPPFLSTSAAHLLLPAEVVESDRAVNL